VVKLMYCPVAALLLFACASGQEVATTSPPQTSLGSRRTTALDSDVALGKPLEWESPKYPKHALENRLQGTVILKLTVAKDGRVKRADAMSGDAEFAESSMRSASKWRYVPYFPDEKAVEVQTIVSINFKINESGQPDITATYKALQTAPTSQIVKAGSGVTAPKVIYSPEPEYSAEAQKAKYENMKECVSYL